MGSLFQLKLLLWKNFKLKYRSLFVTILELIIPLVLFFILLAIREHQPASKRQATHYHAWPLPSSGLVELIEAFCPGGTPDQDGFLVYENATTKQFLTDLNRIAVDYDYFRPSFSPADIRRIPQEYENIVRELGKLVGVMNRNRSRADSSMSNSSTESLNSITSNELLLLALTSATLLENRKMFLFNRKPEKSFNRYPGDEILEKYSDNEIFGPNVSRIVRRIRGFLVKLEEYANYRWSIAQLARVALYLPRDHNCTLTDNSNQSLANETAYNNSSINHQKSDGAMVMMRWMQKTFCGIQPTDDGSTNKNNPKHSKTDDNENIFDALGLSNNQRTNLAFLIRLFRSNPKILYAPNVTIGDQIIQQVFTQPFQMPKQSEANKTFSLIANMTEYSRALYNSTKTMHDFLMQNSTRRILGKIRDVELDILNITGGVEVWAKYPELAYYLNESFLIWDVENNENESSFIDQLQVIEDTSCSWISYMGGVQLDIFKGFSTEQDLLDYFWNRAWLDNVTVFTSVVFQLEENDTLPNHMIYKIRQNASFTTTTQAVRSLFWFPGPRDWDYSYYTRGFLWIQDTLERAMIDLYAERAVLEPGSFVQQFPYPCYVWNNFLWIIEHILPICLGLSWIYSASMLVQRIVYEKEKRLKEVMRTMGLSNVVHWSAWFITSFLQMSVTMTLLTVMLKAGKVLEHSNPVLIWLILEMFAASVIMFSFVISTFYSHAKLAAACAGIIYFMSFVPFFYISIREESEHVIISSWIKSLASLLSTTSFGLGAKYLAYYEMEGVGCQWHNLHVSPLENDRFSLLHVFLFITLDIFLYGILVWYIENIHPGQYGLPKPWYFPLVPSYWTKGVGRLPENPPSFVAFYRTFIKKYWKKSASLNDDGQNCDHDDEKGKKFDADKSTCQFFETLPTNLPIGIEISNLSMIYNKNALPRKFAVNRLSLKLFQHQITAFLGHNGAGKTTTMSILTGLFPPTKGTAKIYGLDIRCDMEEIRKSLGTCPQHNVLYDNLTVEEHLRFYAMLKLGRKSEDIKEEIDRMLWDLGLPDKRNALIDTLSGGMKRKLSVAIAFIGDSRTIILDEPTAGVDPYARRAIWDLILKYRPGRTIMLSTHHMDEADIIADRIAIISQGRLKCVGSPLFLKAQFGDGYRITFLKSEVWEEKDGKESNTRNLTEFLTQFGKEPKLCSNTLAEFQFTLKHWTGQQMWRMFKQLEKDDVLREYNICSYGLQDSTLEEIFLKIAGDQISAEPVSVKTDNSASSSEADAEGMEKDFPTLELPRPTSTNLPRFGLDYQPLTGWHYYGQQFLAILIKRYIYIIRNWRALFTQILLPAFFVCVAMSVALTIILIDKLPMMELSPAQYYNYTRPSGNTIPFGNWPTRTIHLMNDPHFISGEQLIDSLYIPCGMAGTCLLKSPNNTAMSRIDQFNFTNRDIKKQRAVLDKYFIDGCKRVFVNGLQLENFVPPTRYHFGEHEDGVNGGNEEVQLSSREVLMGSDAERIGVTLDPDNSRWNLKWTQYTSTPHSEDEHRLYPTCACALDGTGLICSRQGYSEPPITELVTADWLIDISGVRNESEYYLYTTDMYRLRRYGALSFGHFLNEVPENFGQSPSAPTTFRQIAVGHVSKIWYNNNGYHSMPIYLNAINNALLRAALPEHKGNPGAYGITLINHPIEGTNVRLSQTKILEGTDVLIALFIITALSFVPASFVLFLVSEKQSRAKHLQALNGLSPFIYWSANFIWDLGNYILPALCCCVILRCFNIPAYVAGKNFSAVIMLFLLYGWSITPMMYPATFFFSDPSTAYISMIVLNLFLGITTVMCSFMLELFGTVSVYFRQISDACKLAFLIFPNFCLGRGLMDIAFTHYFNEFWRETGQYSKIRDVFEWEITRRNLVSMLIIGFCSFTLTLILEFRYLIRRQSKKCREKEDLLELLMLNRSFRKNEQSELFDSDVLAERDMILSENGSKSNVLQLRNLTKIYKSRKMGKNVAVDNLCFGLRRGECFGLLGINGAGKTTTFRMLVGDLAHTSGEATLAGRSLFESPHTIGSKRIGYCPQFDALYDELTALEHLQLLARIRGIPKQVLDTICHNLLHQLDLTLYANQPSGTYSGGTKRKLSTALTLIGDPRVILLDEPTTGMDPRSRRFLWDVILRLIGEGKSVLLTSHSMEECEVLCTRLSIMVSGTLRCLGSAQHLKNKYGDGYSLKFRIRNELFDEGKEDLLIRLIGDRLPDAVLKECHFGFIHYELASVVPLSRLFHTAEELMKIDSLSLASYVVTQNNLDNVFVGFVRHQGELEDLQGGVGRRRRVGRNLMGKKFGKKREVIYLDDKMVGAGDGTEDDLDNLMGEEGDELNVEIQGHLSLRI